MSVTTQSNQILAALKSGEKLTPMEALDRFGCFRLGARIYDLRQDGHAITSERVTDGEKTFARYSMEGAQT